MYALIKYRNEVSVLLLDIIQVILEAIKVVVDALLLVCLAKYLKYLKEDDEED